MDRYVLLASLLFSPLVALAQDPAPSPAASSAAPPPLRHENASPERMMEWQERLAKMPEDERAKFVENFHRWQQMTDEEKRHFRERAMLEHQEIQNAIKEAIKKTGLNLSEDQREVFALRYVQERIKIEQGLRKEMETKRTQLLEGVVKNLKDEFSDAKKGSKADKPAEPAATP